MFLKKGKQTSMELSRDVTQVYARNGSDTAATAVHDGMQASSDIGLCRSSELLHHVSST